MSFYSSSFIHAKTKDKSIVKLNKIFEPKTKTSKRKRFQCKSTEEVVFDVQKGAKMWLERMDLARTQAESVEWEV